MKQNLTTPAGTPISNFCFGAMQFGDTADAAESRALYDVCRTAGINFFDTAFGYTGGQSETLLGEFANEEREMCLLLPNAQAPAVRPVPILTNNLMKAASA